MHEWIVDSDLTPHIMANAGVEGVDVPSQAIEDGQVVLNVSPVAVRDLLMDSDGVSFVARFGGASQAVYLPIGSIKGIYARENGRGMLFGEEGQDDVQQANEGEDSSGPEATSSKQSGPKGPTLRVIK